MFLQFQCACKSVPKQSGDLGSLVPEDISLQHNTCANRYIRDANNQYGGNMTVILQIHCTVAQNNTLDFNKFRNISTKERWDILTVFIKCVPGGKLVSLWSERVETLRRLSIRGCNILDHNVESDEQLMNKVKNSVHYVSIQDSTILRDDRRIDKEKRNRKGVLIDMTGCFPLLAEDFVLRNVSYQVLPSQPTLTRIYRSNDIDKTQRPQCIYRDMKLLDISHTSFHNGRTADVVLQNALFPSLEILNLSYANITDIPSRLREWRLYLPKLNAVDLSHNWISEIGVITDHSIAKGKNSIGHIDLRYNNIHTISNRTLRSFLRHKNVVVDIRNNPFICNCEMKYLIEFVEREIDISSNEQRSYGNLRDLKCASPPNLKGRSIVQLSSQELGCTKNELILNDLPVILLFLTSLLLAIMCMVAFTYRKVIIIILYTRLRIPYICKQHYNAEKTYDAFIAYSQHDTEWVLGTLMQRLEKPQHGRAFQLCLHHRDFKLGGAIAENIVISVQESRHTILIISEDFLQSEWCLLEFRTALHQSLLEKRRHLIIVLLDNVACKDIDNDLKRCMKTMTVIKKNDRFFFDKLIYVLSHQA